MFFTLLKTHFMENSKKIQRTAQDYAGKLEELRNTKNNSWYLFIRGRYKAALGKIILNEFLDGTNGRPEQFTKRDILLAIHQAGGREFETYTYDGHRSDPDWYFVDEILDGCIRHRMFVDRSNVTYSRKLVEALKDKEEHWK